MDESAQPEVLTEMRGAVKLITLNRPERGNAFNLPLRLRLHEVLRELQQDQSVRAVVLTGAGKHFCTGADLGRDAALAPADFRENARRYDWIAEFQRVPVPVIAAMEGYTAGAGMALALSCDVRVMAEDGHLFPAFTQRGIAPDNGVGWMLARMVGPGQAMRWLLDASRIPAEEARSTLLVQELVAPGTALERAMEMAQRWASGPTVAFHATKRQVWQALDYRLEDALRFEQDARFLVYQTADQLEGRRAFREKRDPQFKGG
ncbi:MAG: hypothetical protein GEU80_15360 [Dehalococcoidia bacterium]|nr:hypothetical protein [Dehalococcoidia bacterium]